MYRFNFGRLRQLRKKKKMYQRDVATKMGCTASSISKVELGETAITAEDLARLASIYEDDRMSDFFVQEVS